MKLRNQMLSWGWVGGPTPQQVKGIYVRQWGSSGSGWAEAFIRLISPGIEIPATPRYGYTDTVTMPIDYIQIEHHSNHRRGLGRDVIRLTPDRQDPTSYILLTTPLGEAEIELFGAYDNSQFVSSLAKVGFEVLSEE